MLFQVSFQLLVGQTLSIGSIKFLAHTSSKLILPKLVRIEIFIYISNNLRREKCAENINVLPIYPKDGFIAIDVKQRHVCGWICVINNLPSNDDYFAVSS